MFLSHSSASLSLPAGGKSVGLFDTRASIETGSFFAQKRIYENRTEREKNSYPTLLVIIIC